MTKQEKEKCEKLLNEVAMSLDRADVKWKNYEDVKRGGCDCDKEISLRDFDLVRIICKQEPGDLYLPGFYLPIKSPY